MDLFKEYLNKKDTSKWVKRALTDSSYKKEYEIINHKPFEGKDNSELATYGDAVIRLCFCEILLDNVEKLSKDKSTYESDEYLTKTVASHYHMLDYIDTDTNDILMKRNYDFIKPEKTEGGYRKDSPHKYIATAVEAMIGAIYKEKRKLYPIVKLLKSWMDFEKTETNNN